MSLGITILIAVLISFLILFTVLGNSFVLFAFLIDKRLRNQSDFVLLNLAICDFFIGAFTSPLYLLYMLTGKWMLGRFLCKLWLTADYTICAASVFNIVLISYDRFLAVTKAVLYRSLQNKQSHTVLSMCVVWIMSFLLYGPAILFWKNDFIDNDIAADICVVGFHDTWYFHLGTSCVDFVLPLISISFFNISIYHNIKRRSRKKRQTSASEQFREKEKAGRLSIIATNSVLFSLQPHGVNMTSLRHYFCNKHISFPTNNGRVGQVNVQITKLSRDKRLFKSLLILVCVFVICWAPFSFLASINSACTGYCVDSYWYEITFWMLYMNSAINPILYPLCHKKFRNAFSLVFKNNWIHKHN
ncbi:hypothetical protein GDO86_011070 [Hymenochirus boettgeri]|uniref:G-protein coupled receptors family 1 profile domain-containing protein n=1 Tax=Hymenochirus boettgeri TaxID=247094 RepID=A0A8T2JFP5_9PIPI|nr:hypothetical protein GDO86_011070 [Hymenochirus boettgeri]